MYTYIYPAIWGIWRIQTCTHQRPPILNPKPDRYNPSLTNLLRRRSTSSRWFPEIRRRRLLAGGSRTVGPERNASRRNTKLRASGRTAGNTCTDCRLFRGLCNALASRVHRCTKPRRTPYTLYTTTTIFRSKVRIIDSTWPRPTYST